MHLLHAICLSSLINLEDIRLYQIEKEYWKLNKNYIIKMGI